MSYLRSYADSLMHPLFFIMLAVIGTIFFLVHSISGSFHLALDAAGIAAFGSSWPMKSIDAWRARYVNPDMQRFTTLIVVGYTLLIAASIFNPEVGSWSTLVVRSTCQLLVLTALVIIIYKVANQSGELEGKAIKTLSKKPSLLRPANEENYATGHSGPSTSSTPA